MTEIERLLGIMRRLRDPQSGCPWDKEQTFSSIAPYTLEETYEVLDAIADVPTSGPDTWNRPLTMPVIKEIRIEEE